MSLHRFRYVITFLLISLTTLPFLGRGLFETSEGRYAMVAKTMNDSGNYWMPSLNGKEHLTKPPLTYWVIAASQKIFGNNTYGSRLLHTFCWILLALILVRCGDLLWGEKGGFLCGLIFTTSLFPSLGAWSLTTDPLLVFFQAISFWALLEFRRQRNILWSIVFWSGLGLAFNTKGPVSLVPFGFWLIFLKESRLLLKSRAVVLFFLIGCFWYLGLEFMKPGILAKLISEEIIKRSSTDFSGRNPHWWAPILIYILPFMVGWGVWPFFSKREAIISSLRDQRIKLCMAWILGSLLMFSFIQSRLILYILPLVIPATLLMAKSLLETKRIKYALVTNLLLVLGIKTFGTYIYKSDSDAKEISSFASSHSDGKKVYFLNEYLYGVEFYMGKNFARFANHHSAIEALKKDKSIEWIVFQDKRKDILSQVTKNLPPKINQHKKFGKWNLVEIKSNHFNDSKSEVSLKK